MDEAVVALHDLESVLNAVVLSVIAGCAGREVAHDLDAVDSAVIHYLQPYNQQSHFLL